MTLLEWSQKQPVKVQRHPKFFNSFCCPDVPTLVDRSEAWRLEDYLVSSVAGGSIWFFPKDTIKELRS